MNDFDALPVSFDKDALLAAVELVGRCAARNFEIGWLNDAPPYEWWASAQFQGARVMVEHHVHPVDAAEALAQRLLTGAMCNWCKGLIALSPEGAIAYAEGHLVDGTRWNVEDSAPREQCLWVREGAHWIRGCEERFPDRVGNARARRAQRRNN